MNSIKTNTIIFYKMYSKKFVYKQNITIILQATGFIQKIELSLTQILLNKICLQEYLLDTTEY